MDTQNRFPTAPFRAVNHHLAIKATGAKQGRVKDIGTVGCGQNHNGLVWLEAIHLDKQLLQCMFSFIVAGNGTRAAACSPDGIDLIDENDAGGMFARLRKQVAYTTGSDADEEFDKVGSTYAEEWHPCLTGHGAGQQGLARPRWADQQHAFGNMRADLEETLGVAQEVDNFTQFHFGFVHPCHVGESGCRALFTVELRAAATDAKEAATLQFLHLAHAAPAHKADVEQEEDWQQVYKPYQSRLPPGRLDRLRTHLYPLFLQQR